MHKGGIQRIKAKKVEVEIWNASMPSSHHADTLCNPQCDQSSVKDTQTDKWT